MGFYNFIFSLMTLTFTGTRLEITEAIAAYAEKKLARLARFFTNAGAAGAIQAHLELEKTTRHHKRGPVFRAELKLVGPRISLFVEETAEDLYAAIDEVKEEMERKLAVRKDRAVSMRKGMRREE